MTAVWLYGTKLGELSRPRSSKLRFDFTQEAVDRWGDSATIMSTSLLVNSAVRPTGDVVLSFFQNLLPEGTALTTVKTMFQTFDELALLEAIGSDTVGALIIANELPQHQMPGPRFLSDDDIVDLLEGLPDHPLGVGPAVRHSLAGVQPKLLLGRSVDGRWHEADALHPSTHLMKPAPLNHPEVATNEAFCLEIARRIGLPTSNTHELQFGSARVLVVERFDRTILNGVTTRLHQEDACQMLGISPNRKYQQRMAGRKTIGPSLNGIARWLPLPDRVRLLQTQVLNIMIGNADCHGKNISVIHPADGTVLLAPLYDVMSTVVHHPIETARGARSLSEDLGMFIGNATSLRQVTQADFLLEASRWGIGRDQASNVINTTTSAIAAHTQSCRSMYPAIADYAERAAEQLSR
jgi:serine/threonine-protein kinase HipA